MLRRFKESILKHLKHASTLSKTSYDTLRNMLRNTIRYCSSVQISFTHISSNGDHRKQQGWPKTVLSWIYVREEDIEE